MLKKMQTTKFMLALAVALPSCDKGETADVGDGESDDAALTHDDDGGDDGDDDDGDDDDGDDDDGDDDDGDDDDGDDDDGDDDDGDDDDGDDDGENEDCENLGTGGYVEGETAANWTLEDTMGEQVSLHNYCGRLIFFEEGAYG